MASNMTPQRVQMSLAALQGLFPPSSSSLPSPPNSPSPASFASLPPELIKHIFESIPVHPYDNLVTSLASLCLINHLFLEIARPLLYRQVYLDFSQDYDKTWSEIHQLFQTLLKVKHCSTLVKAIRIRMDEVKALEVTALAYLLSQLECLESIQTGLIERTEAEEFMDAICRHQPGLKHLELRGVDFAWPNHWMTLLALERLETLVGDQFDSLGRVNLTCKLHRFVSHSSLTRPTFEHILHYSWTSLTSLAFAINPEYADLDLRQLINLDTLRIVLEDDTSGTLEPRDVPTSRLYCAQMPQFASFAGQVREILRSAQSLPIKTLSITVKEDYVPQVMAPHLLLDPLPSLIRHFGTIFEFLDFDGVNYPELVKALHGGRLDYLAKITIFPSEGDLLSYRQPPIWATQRRLSELEARLGITVAPYQTSPDLVSEWYTSEPYVEETDGKEEDNEGSEEY